MEWVQLLNTSRKVGSGQIQYENSIRSHLLVGAMDGAGWLHDSAWLASCIGVPSVDRSGVLDECGLFKLCASRLLLHVFRIDARGWKRILQLGRGC